MNRKLQGILIRQRRQELNWSQAGLCAGICAVSYLSRIEQARVEGTDEVLGLLFQRLEIPWREDPEFCGEAGVWFEGWYDRLFAGDNLSALKPELEKRREEYRFTPFWTDWLMLTWQVTGQAPEELKELLPALDERQSNLRLCLLGAFEELLPKANQSYYFLRAGERFLRDGNYGNAMNCLQNAKEKAYWEGSLTVQMESCAYLGSCYSNLNQLVQARMHYALASRMARSLGRQEDVQTVSYNLAVAEINNGQPELALRHLLEHPWEEGMYYHKLALCYELLDRKDKAREALNRALEAPFGTTHLDARSYDADAIRTTFEQMCELVRMRLDNPHYLKNPAYGEALRTCVHNQKKYLSMGFVCGQIRWLLEWYTANRQYQKAYDVLRSTYLND